MSRCPRPRSTRRPELECLEDRLVPTTLYGLTDNNFIVQFDSASPSSFNNAAVISGLQAGERIVGMDFRPRTGQLYGVGIVSGATDTVRVAVRDRYRLRLCRGDTRGRRRRRGRGGRAGPVEQR